MAEFIFKNRQVQFPNRIKLTPVSGQANVYEVETRRNNYRARNAAQCRYVLGSFEIRPEDHNAI